MPTRTKKRAAKKPQAAASIVWFEVPADDLDRAKKFYGSLFGWTFAKIPAAISDYWHIDTGGKDATPDGGLMPRMYPEQSITNYVGVPSVTDGNEEGRETRRGDLQGQDGGARHGVFRHLSGHGGQYLCPMGDERAR
jgi:predicted enzyme related to lactoylglutathione lyase